MKSLIPELIPNQIDGKDSICYDGRTIEKINPANGKHLCRLTRSTEREVGDAVSAAESAREGWAWTTPVARGEKLYDLVSGMKAHREDIAKIVAMETGKSMKEALGETDGAVALGRFFAGEGQRFFGRTRTSGVPNRFAQTVRQPIGVAGLIIAANTPIANVAWKIFPALICGNAVVLKAAEDTPATAWIVGKIAKETGLPDGVINIIQGLGHEAGEALVADTRVGVVSFTGSTSVGRQIAEIAGKRLARVSLELGGKNPLVVCDDADIDNAIKWTMLSAFSNAGQRCAAAGRIIVFDDIYESFRDRLVGETRKLRVGPGDEDDLGPVINQGQLGNMIEYIERAVASGARILCGGKRLTTPEHRDGFYMAPTVIEEADSDAEISTTELFGPVTCLYRAADFNDALELANTSPYGLTASIHTRSIHRAMAFTQKIAAGVAMVNAGTYGSEPHMPFGGVKKSGNGTREPGTEALNVYSELKNIVIQMDPDQV